MDDALDCGKVLTTSVGLLNFPRLLVSFFCPVTPLIEGMYCWTREKTSLYFTSKLDKNT